MGWKASIGTKLTPADATLTGFDTLPATVNKGAQFLEVYKGVTEAVLEATGQDYAGSTKAVLVVLGTPDLVPPNFKAMLQVPMVVGTMGAIFGELQGCIVKHFVGSTWGDRNRGGGIYFFTAPEHIDTYLASSEWEEMSKGTPWTDVTYAKYVLG